MFDNDYYSLREALRELGPGVIGSAIHPHVFISALRSADIVIATSAMQHEAIVGADDIDEMKRGVIAFDLSDRPGQFFPITAHRRPCSCLGVRLPCRQPGAHLLHQHGQCRATHRGIWLSVIHSSTSSTRY